MKRTKRKPAAPAASQATHISNLLDVVNKANAARDGAIRELRTIQASIADALNEPAAHVAAPAASRPLVRQLTQAVRASSTPDRSKTRYTRVPTRGKAGSHGLNLPDSEARCFAAITGSANGLTRRELVAATGLGVHQVDGAVWRLDKNRGLVMPVRA